MGLFVSGSNEMRAEIIEKSLEIQEILAALHLSRGHQHLYVSLI